MPDELPNDFPTCHQLLVDTQAEYDALLNSDPEAAAELLPFLTQLRTQHHLLQQVPAAPTFDADTLTTSDSQKSFYTTAPSR